MSSLSTGSRIAATSTARVNYLSGHRQHEDAEAQADGSVIDSDCPLRFVNMIISEAERADWELRDASEMTLARAGEFLQRNAATVSRFESGEYPIRRPDLMALLDLYGVSERRKRDGLLRLSEEVWQKGWWDSYAEDVESTLYDRLLDSALGPGESVERVRVIMEDLSDPDGPGSRHG